MTLASHSPTRRNSKQNRRSDGAAEGRFKDRLEAVAVDTEAMLDQLLRPKPLAGEMSRPARLMEAMRYSSLGGGKRIRPFLVVETARLFAVPRRRALHVAAALECVHCYSLVHDDLPAMDDDALRRGRPTLHKAYDDATAILAGDGLLTLAFEILSREQTHPKPAVRVELVSALAKASGIGGMVGGQMLDLAAEGRFANGGGGNAPLGMNDVKMLQAMKTGALLAFACTSGGILGGAKPAARKALARYGAAIGEAFQIADDLLDVDGDPAIVGKATGKDAAARKATFVSLLGIERARERLNSLVKTAESAADSIGKNAGVLKAAANFIADRKN